MHYWNTKATRIVKGLLALHGVPRKELVRRLKAVGVKDSKAAIASKLSRGKFSFAFFLQVVAAIGVKHVEFEEFDPDKPKPFRSNPVEKN